jgi:hypothetical protein
MQNQLTSTTSSVGQSHTTAALLPGLGAIMLCFVSLFDFYKYAIRLFDFVAYAVVLMALLWGRTREGMHPLWPVALALASVYASCGIYFHGAPASSLVLFLNVTLFFIFRSKLFSVSSGGIRTIVAGHLLFFYLQLAAFHLTGEIVNFHSFTDIDPRLEAAIFRPAGLFYEPAIYCLALFALLTILETTQRRPGLLEALSIFSMLASVSLLGFALASMLLCRWILLGNIRFITFFAPALIFVDAEYFDPIQAFVISRLSDIEGDASTEGRYGGFTDLFLAQTPIKMLFGSGFGADFESFGGSGASAAISSIGLFGTALLVLGLLTASNKRGLTAIALIGAMVSAPVFTYAIFPFWMAQLVRTNDPPREQHSPAPRTVVPSA